MARAKKSITTLQVLHIPRTDKKTNGHANGLTNGTNKFGLNSKNFETRFEPRYKKMPAMPDDLETPTFSESSNKILKERYLLKGGELETVETVAERFWHIAYDIASADFDFGSSPSQVLELAKKFYAFMVRQEFLPNSPTIMNSGKQNQLQYSACFVLPVPDSIEGIFDGMKYTALIHKSGGGCVSADSRVWTTFCGIEPIETLFARVTVDGREGIRQGNGLAYDVSDLNIKTASLNPQTGETGLQKVTHVWKYSVAEKDQIVVKTIEGTKVQTSSWHPFMILRGTEVAEVRTDELKRGDVVFGPTDPSKYWPWNDNKTINSLEIDEDLGWLIGFTLGDGSFGYVPALRQYRLRWFSGVEDVLKKVQEILAKRGINLTIQKDKRGLLSLSTLNQRFVYDFLEACGLEKFGPKDSLIRVPEIISKSPYTVVQAFLAGLMDSDGYVAPDGSPSYCSVSQAMSEDLAALVGLLGYRPTTQAKAPHGKGKQTNYIVQLCPLPQVNKLSSEISQFMASELRKGRLQSVSKKQTSLPIDFRAWRDILKEFGLVNKKFDKLNGIGPLSRELNHWSSYGKVRRDDLKTIAKKLVRYNSNLSGILEKIADSGQEIASVSPATESKVYYDLSVDNWNTYAAGKSGLMMIHNTGFAFSRLRPNGSFVKKSGGVASGPVSFLRVYDAATQAIKQGGTRRGANMGILRIDHPDILEFIRSKSELDEQNTPVYEGVKELLDDTGKEVLRKLLLDRQISNFNISAAMTDDFMSAYYQGKNYNLINPLDNEVTGQLNAKDVLEEMVNRAWATGDPGCIFIDRINHSPANPVPSLGDIESTNPCITGDTLVSTKEGWRRVDEIFEGDHIQTVLGGGIVNKVEIYDDVPVYRVKFSDGAELKVTAAHQFHAIPHNERSKNSANKQFSLISLKDLKVGDMVRVSSALMPDNPVNGLPEGWTDKEYGFFVGVLLGDGCITEKTLNRNVVKVAVNTDESEWVELIRNVLKKTGSKIVSLDVGLGRSANLTVQDGSGAAMMVRHSYLVPSYSFEKKIPDEYRCTNKNFLAGLLDGLFSTDGNVNLGTNHPMIRFKTTSKQLATDVRRILLYFGIHGRIATIKNVAESQIGDRIITSKHQQYEVLISGMGMKIFADQIGLSHPDKHQKLIKAQKEFAMTGNTWLARILSIEPEGAEKVYDLFEPISDTWVTEGIVSRGCGEQPLYPWDACNLGSINLGKFVRQSTDGNYEVDWDGLSNASRTSVHFLDNVVQVNPYTIEEIYNQVHNVRRIGLGVMGWADMLFRLGIPYDCQEALDLAEKVMKCINDEGHKMSEELAELRGPFPLWKESIYAEKKHPSFKDKPESYAYASGKPIRNSTITTIAPTGTISIIGDCSSGIEPVFALAYIHRAKGDGGETGNEMRYLTIANQTFKDIAREKGFWSEDLAQKVMEKGSVKGINEVPAKWQGVFTTAGEINPQWHVKMQAAFQKYTDNAVSKTINLPEEATRDDVRQAYLLAWETGCNGITVYRNNSKTTQVLNVASTLKQKEQTSAGYAGEGAANVAVEEGEKVEVARPVILRGRTYKMFTPVGKAYVTVNRDENDSPFEVFVSIGKAGMHTLADAEAIGRLVSLSLRISRPHSKEVAAEIVEHLHGIGGASQVGFGKDRIMSLADAVAKALMEDMNLNENTVKEGVEPIPLNLTIGLDGMDEAPIASDDMVKSQLSLNNVDLCPECGSPSFVMEEGCTKCYSCGYSKC